MSEEQVPGQPTVTPLSEDTVVLASSDQNEEVRTKLINDPQEASKVALNFIRNAGSELDIVSTHLSENPPKGAELLADVFFDGLKKGMKVRLITSIAEDNIAYSKELVKVFEIRHLDSIRGNFAVGDHEYAAVPGSREFGPEGAVLYSNMPEVVEQNRYLFEVLWSKAMPADLRIGLLEGGEAIGETTFTFSTKEIFESATRFAEGMKEEAEIIVPREGGIHDNLAFFTKVVARGTQVGARIRMLAEFSKEEIPLVKKFQEKGVQVRILGSRQKLNLALGIYDRKHMGLVQYIDPESRRPTSGTYLSGVISSNDQIIDWVRSMFEVLWENGTPAEQEIARLQKGIAPPELRIIHDPLAAQKLIIELLQHSKTEILLLFPTTNAFRREEKLGSIELLKAASRRGVQVKVIFPFDSTLDGTLQALNEELIQDTDAKLVYYKGVAGFGTPNTVTVVIVDGLESLIIEQKDDSQQDFANAVGASTYSARNSTVSANLRFFERMLDEIDLREREEILLDKEQKSRREAELMQDILSHDIRNFNQIIGLNAELLKVETKEESQRRNLDSILRAVEGATELIENAKKMGRISNAPLSGFTPIDVIGSINDSISLLRRANPEKELEVTLERDDYSGPANVIADRFLPEVFTNVMSNCIRYTDGIKVPIEIKIERQPRKDRGIRAGSPKEPEFLKVSISDRGKGIDDQTKESIFTRYKSSSTGSGLGLSIVHALVVERYSGRLMVKSRVQGDYTGGTTVEVWLPKSAS